MRYLLPLILFLTACAPAEKFPFPPQFVTIEEVGLNALPAPPKPNSATQKRELAQIIAIQSKMSQAEKDKVMGEDSITPEMMVQPILGDAYTRESHSALYTLLAHAASDSWRIGDAVQEHWNRQRPWVVDKRVALYVKPITRPSYPSGHSNTNHVWAHVLSELFPAKRDALFTRAYAIGTHRMKGGVHFPSDVEGGKKLAAIIFKEMRGDAQFQRELHAAREELLQAAAANDNAPLPVENVAACH